MERRSFLKGVSLLGLLTVAPVIDLSILESEAEKYIVTGKLFLEFRDVNRHGILDADKDDEVYYIDGGLYGLFKVYSGGKWNGLEVTDDIHVGVYGVMLDRSQLKELLDKGVLCESI